MWFIILNLDQTRKELQQRNAQIILNNQLSQKSNGINNNLPGILKATADIIKPKDSISQIGSEEKRS